MGAVVQGQALGGIFAAATNVIMLAFGASDVDAAFWDFLIAVIFLASALVAFIVLTRSEFYQVMTVVSVLLQQTYIVFSSSI